MTAVRIATLPTGDVELARLCAMKDPAALRQVITANNQRLFRAAWSILKDRSEAEDAVQSAYLKAFARIGEFEGRSALSTWLTRITINEALGRLRSSRRRKKNLEDQGVSVLDHYRETLMRGSQPAAPDASLAREQLRQLLERAAGRLSCARPSQTRLLRARRKLRDALEPDVHSAMVGAFPFAGADCEAMTEKVLTAVLNG